MTCAIYMYSEVVLDTARRCLGPYARVLRKAVTFGCWCCSDLHTSNTLPKEFRVIAYFYIFAHVSPLAPFSLPCHQAWVHEYFSGVRNTAPPTVPDYGPAPAFGATELARKVTVIPLRETRKLALSWPLPPRSVHKRSKPTLYVSHLLVSRRRRR